MISGVRANGCSSEPRTSVPLTGCTFPSTAAKYCESARSDHAFSCVVRHAPCTRAARISCVSRVVSLSFGRNLVHASRRIARSRVGLPHQQTHSGEAALGSSSFSIAAGAYFSCSIIAQARKARPSAVSCVRRWKSVS